MNILRPGSRDAEVILLQRLLNNAFGRDLSVPALDTDGVFGPHTERNLRLFQSRNRGPSGPLGVDGVVGPATWRALGLVTEVVRRIAPVGQSTQMSCWAVTAGVATGRMQSAMPPITVQLGATGGLRPSLPNLEAFAREYGMRLMNHIPMEMAALLPMIRQGNLMLAGEWLNGARHLVAVTGYYQGPSADTTMLRINDPDPMGQGSISVTDYPLMRLRGGEFAPYALIVP